MTGAVPNTPWLRDCVALDEKGLRAHGVRPCAPRIWRPARWPLPRAPHLLETSLPGVFAVGDVRSGSVKRIASAVGEGSICVQFVHTALREISVSLAIGFRILTRSRSIPFGTRPLPWSRPIPVSWRRKQRSGRAAGFAKIHQSFARTDKITLRSASHTELPLSLHRTLLESIA